MTLNELQTKLKKAWSKETSYLPNEWSMENPALGQCAVTSLVVNDHLGGDIVWANVTLPDGEEVSHYFNLINGEEVDLTRSQFPVGSNIPVGIPRTGGLASTREHLLANESTIRRYSLLKELLKDS